MSLVGAITVVAPLASTSCSSTPVNVPVRTFERAQKVDVVCLQVFAPDPANPGFEIPIRAKPLRQAECAPVGPGVDGHLLPNHLFALVTQTTRGEIALVDLTAGWVVDEDRSTPGINFIPVGALPTDVAVAPDGVMSFVSTAEPNKPALYGIPSDRALGDSQWPVPFTIPPPLTLPALPACSLPQIPVALAIIPRAGAAPTGGDAGSEAGVGTDAGAAVTADYEVAAILAGSGGARAKMVTIDPRPLLRGAGVDVGAGPKVDPGSLEPCPVTSVVELGSALPSSIPTGKPWDDGVKYVDGGVDLAPTEPPLAAACATTMVDSGAPDASEAGVTDAGVAEAGDAAIADAGVPDAPPIDFGPLDPPRPTALVFDDQNKILYVSDDALPLIHAIDVSVPGAPHELAPLVASSVDAPSRKVSVGALAISPATSEFKRFLYAVDKKQGSLLVYDVTLGAASAKVPLVRPHPELNPFQPIDRLVFNAPVAAVAFVRSDWPLTQKNGQPLTAAKTGLICNPNPNAHCIAGDPKVGRPDDTRPGCVGVDQTALTAFADTDQALGASYTPSSGLIAITLGPYRLRGIFALVTLSNGQIVVIDVDDWDAPCRRPDPLGPDTTTGTSQPSALAAAEPVAADPSDTDPYHAPSSLQTAAGVSVATTSLEAFFPVSAPHRPRSSFFLRNDPTTGLHVPNVVSVPQLIFQNAARTTTGNDGLANPILLPTFSNLADPTYTKNPSEPNPANRQSTLAPLGNPKTPFTTPFSLPVSDTTPGVRFSWENPQVHVDQDWQVTYEGVLPGFDGIAAAVATTPGDATAYSSLTLSVPNGLLCRLGIEDARLGHDRVDAELAEMQRLGIPQYVDPYKWTGDYVQLADDILPQGDPYWDEKPDAGAGADCWDPALTTADAKQFACQSTFGSLNDPIPTTFRDFPILEAYDDHLVVGRFGYLDPKNPATVNRVIVERDQSNVAALKLMRCCFHNQAHFKVRTGGRWVTVGATVGYLHHVTAAPDGACVQSCEPREQLLSSRAPDVPRPLDNNAAQAPGRNSPLAMRNPMFSFVVWSGAPPKAATPQAPAPGHTTSQRDMIWRFSTRGQYIPLTIALSASSTTVSPQSMRFIDSLGQVAVIDGASQGLVLIDLGTVGQAHAPYF